MPQETPTLEDLELSVDRGPRPAGSPGPSDAQDSPDPAKALLGRVLKGQYVISSVLGQGAMGLVFRGTQRGLEKVVAIKVMHLEGMHTREWRDRFEREATAVSKVLHPGITQVLDFGIESGMPFLVMEFVDGKELTEVLEKEGPMPPARALLIVRQLASALEEAHRHGIVHRDIKPQNLRLMRYTPGGQIFLKVLDFGIAKQLGDGAEKGKLTATGAVMGTPMYMAPEQAGGQRVDFRADQYAVGIVLYELLTGTVPFTGETLTGVLVSHLTKPPPPLPRQVPEPLQKVVMRLLAKSPAERFADMAELDRALAACEPACRDVPALQLGRVQPHVAGGVVTPPPPGRSLLLGGVAAGAGIALLIAVAVLGPRLRDRKTRGADPSLQPTAASLTTGDRSAVPSPAVATAASPTVGTGEKPESGRAAPPAPAGDKGATKPEPATADARKPRGTPKSAPTGSFTPEPPEIKEKLDEAQKLLDSGDGIAALELAKRTQSAGRFARAYRIMTLGSCQDGNIGMAKSAFPNVAPQDRAKVIKFCRQHDKDLSN
jgi:serine/threonine-protein kinase